ncbi:MAG: hypothetical protein PF904_05020 [Kiritimatiellae bacterium]|jgi:hypothetical protein|nr:hypothetical protein [Kiritimatiellia bacterium]
MKDLLSLIKKCSGRYILFAHIHPTKEDHMDLMIEDYSNGNLICYNHPKAFSSFPSESRWTFYGLKDIDYLNHNGEIRPGFGALNPVETGVFEITQDTSDHNNNIFILKTTTTRKYRISCGPNSSIILSEIE